MSKRCFLLCFMVVLLAVQSNASWKLLIVSDTNRDGKVSFTDDLEGRNTWTNQSGAVFMFNDDSDQNNGKQDCTDKTVNGPNDLLDLAPLFIQQVPQLEDNSRLFILVSESARPYVNLFYKNGNDYVFVENKVKQEIPLPLLKGGDVELRIEANSYAFPGWDGKADITATLEAPDSTSTDSVQLKVAPFIMLSSVQKAKRIYVRDYPGHNEKLIQAMKELTVQIGVELKIIGPAAYPPLGNMAPGHYGGRVFSDTAPKPSCRAESQPRQTP